MSKPSSFFLRSEDGKVIPIPAHFKYLELRSADGLTAVVLAIEEDKVVMFSKNDPEASRYIGNFSDVRFCDKIKIP
jgi:tricorn protease-like protein